MLNPFLSGFDPKPEKSAQIANDEQMAQAGGQLVRHSLSLRLGRLLIRMGNKLTREEPLQYKSGHLAS